MVQKIENHSFREGKSMDGCQFSVRMCEKMISIISTLWQLTLCNVLVGHDTPSSIILKQKYHLKWSKNKTIAVFVRGNHTMDSCYFSVRMCEKMISIISTTWQSTLWNVLVGHDTPSSIILKQKYHFKWSKIKIISVFVRENLWMVAISL